MKNIKSYIIPIFLFLLSSCSDSGDPMTCLKELDCNNECGGNAIIDECGECGGNGLNSNGCCGEQTDCIKYSIHIQPIFDQHCISCHGNSGGVKLSSYDALMNTSSNIIPFNYENSLVWKEINSGSMPLGANKLDQNLIDLIATWISEGAIDN